MQLQTIEQTHPRRYSFIAGAIAALCIFASAAFSKDVSSTREEGIDLLDIVIRMVTPGPTTTITQRSPNREFRYTSRGQITFTQTEDDVADLKGRIRIEEKRDGHTRRIEIRSAGPDGIMRIYKVDGREQALDVDGRRWLAEMIASTLRETPIDAFARAHRLHAKGGADAVISEIERIQSDYARRVYCEALVEIAKLDEASKSRVLAAIAAMHSDFEKRSALLGVLKSQTLSVTQQAALLNSLAKMGSAFEQRNVLVAIAPSLSVDPIVTKAWQAAVSKVHSDFEVRTVVESVAARESVSAAHAEMAIDATMGMSSDFERAQVLKEMVKHLPATGGSVLPAFFRSVQKLHSDFERRGVLTALVGQVEMDRASYGPLFESIGAINSNHEKLQVLTALAARMPRDAEVVARYRAVARGLADHERGRAEQALDQLKL
jgi:hypothetical protein